MNPTTQTPTLSFPPFPKMFWDGYRWSFQMRFPLWKGHQIIDAGRRRTTGKAKVHVMLSGQAPSEEQASTYRFLLDNESTMASKLLTELFKRYKRDRSELEPDEDDDEELARRMPRLTSKEDMVSIYELSQVHILPIAKQKAAYVGFEFGCEYDLEHGVGIMTHRKRVVASGGADHAFLEWIAERDV